MICKNCGTNFSNMLAACPKCKTLKGKGEKFKVELPKEALAEFKQPPTIRKVMVNNETKRASGSSLVQTDSDEVLVQEKEVKAEPIPVATAEKKPKVTAETVVDDTKEELNSIEVDTNEELKSTEGDTKEEIKPTEVDTKEELKSIEDDTKEELEKSDDEVSLETEAEDEVSQEVSQEETKDNEPEVSKKTKNEKLTKKQLILQKKAQKEEADATRMIFICMSFVVVAILALSLIAGKTDLFDGTDTTVRTIALSSLSSTESEKVQVLLEQVSPIFATESYNCETADLTDALDLIKPQANKGFADTFDLASVKKESTNADPMQIFFKTDEDDEVVWEYYTVDASEISQVLSALDLKETAVLLTDTYYSYGTKYYFSCDKVKNSKQVTDIKITKSNKILGGNFYVEFSYIVSDTELMGYAIVENISTSEGSTWSLREFSTQPMFDKIGEKIEEETSPISYTIKRETVVLSTSDGKVFNEYQIDYPVFNGDFDTVQILNKTYSDLIAVYKSGSDNADALYDALSEDEKKNLPIKTYINIDVARCDEDVISVLEQSTETSLDLITDDEDEIKPIFNTSFTAYNYNTQEAFELNKDEILGGHTNELTQILYRIYSGYTYDDLISGDGDDAKKPDDIADDTDLIGSAIYNSSVLLVEDGVEFEYVGVNGEISKILVKNEVFDILDQAE